MVVDYNLHNGKFSSIVSQVWFSSNYANPLCADETHFPSPKRKLKSVQHPDHSFSLMPDISFILEMESCWNGTLPFPKKHPLRCSRVSSRRPSVKRGAAAAQTCETPVGPLNFFTQNADIIVNSSNQCQSDWHLTCTRSVFGHIRLQKGTLAPMSLDVWDWKCS